MIHEMKLNAGPFLKMASGTKTIELRLNDTKRRRVQTGDHIVFSMVDSPERKLTVQVAALHYFVSFRDLYAAFSKEELGYASDDPADPEDMDAYYAKEDQEKYGVVGIEIRLCEETSGSEA